MTAFDEVLCEIGDRDHLEAEDARRAGLLLAMVAADQPQATLRLMVGGFDQDPRELWEVPAVRAYVRGVAAVAGINDWRSPVTRRLSQGSIVLLVKCGAMLPGHPFQVEIVEGAAP